MQKRIYLDHASSTPLDERVKKEMGPYWSEVFGNPGGIHQEGQEAKRAVEKARDEIAEIIGVSSDEIIFTSGGTEANSLALIGHLNYLENKNQLNGAHIITSAIEHPASNAGVTIFLSGLKSFTISAMNLTVEETTKSLS